MNTISYSKIHELLGQWIKNFSWIVISPNKDEWFGFFGQDLTNVDFSNSEITDPNFTSAILIETSFRGVKFYLNEHKNTDIFKEVKEMRDVDFRDAKFYLESNNSYDISFPPSEIDIKDILSSDQHDNAIKTDEEYKKFLERKNQEQKTQLESTSEKQINSLVEWFEKLEKEYSFEEKFWIRIISLIFFVLIYLAFLPLLLSFYNKIYIILIPIVFFMLLYLSILEQLQPDRKIWKIQLYYKYFIEDDAKFNIFISVLIFFIVFDFAIIPNIHIDNVSFSVQNYYFISPVIIIFVTLLYFSVTQYSKSKKLRIDNQNKIALIHGMIAIKADTTNMEKWRFYDKIAEIVFDKVHHDKGENLPIDKIIQIIKATNWQK